jgi:hypothetical protein
MSSRHARTDRKDEMRRRLKRMMLLAVAGAVFNQIRRKRRNGHA